MAYTLEYFVVVVVAVVVCLLFLLPNHIENSAFKNRSDTFPNLLFASIFFMCFFFFFFVVH